MPSSASFSPFHRAALAPLAAAVALSCSLSTLAADGVYWNGGGGTWDTTNAEWTTDATLSTGFAAWDNASGLAAYFTGAAGTVMLSEPIAASALTFTAGGYTLAGQTLTLSGTTEINTGSGTQTISSVLAGSSDIFTKSGSGTLVLSGANTLAATTELVVSGGTLALRGSGASLGIAGAASRLIVRDAGAFTVDAGGTVKSSDSLIGGTSATATVDGAGSTWTMTGRTTVGTGGNGALTISNGGKVIDTKSTIGYGEAGFGSVTVTGAGSVWFTKSMFIGDGVDTQGTLTIENGGVVHNAGNSIRMGTGATAVANLIVTGTGSLLTGGLPTDVTAKKTALQVGSLGTATALISAGGKINGSSGSIGGELIFDAIGKGDVTVTGAGSSWLMTSNFKMDGESTLTIAAGGVVTSASSLIGASAISTSTVTIGGNGASWTDSSAVILGDFGSGTLNLNAGGSFSTGQFLRLGGEEGSSSTIVQTGGTLTVGTYLAFNAGTPVYRLEGGTLIAGGSGSNAIYVDGNTEGYTFELAGGTVQAKGAGLVSYADATLRNGTVSTLSTPTSASQLMYWEGVISGGGGLAKTGAGILYLDNANTYTGATAVSAGTLCVNGSLANTTITVASGATLGGSGSIGGPTTLLAGSILAPGNSVGILTFTNDLTLLGTTLMELAAAGTRGTAYDGLNITGGTLAFGGALTVTLLNGFSPVAGNSFDLFNFSLASGTFANLNLPALGTGLTWDASALYTTGVLSVSTSAIPEPSTYATLAGLAGLALAVWRRKQRRAR